MADTGCRMSTKEQIIEAADQLFYRQGYEHTSFTDIASAVNISRGNFYYHFRTKDEILESVIGLRQENTHRMLAQWEAESESPRERIRSYINILITNWSKIRLHGCPVGTLCAELTKLEHSAQPEARAVFAIFRNWLGEQFRQLGCGKESDALAMHVLAWSQGVALLANSFRDEKFMRQQVAQISAWLDALAPTRSV